MCFFFFFKQKTAYEMLRSLVGSEMCIRDSKKTAVVAIVSKVGVGRTVEKFHEINDGCLRRAVYDKETHTSVRKGIEQLGESLKDVRESEAAQKIWNWVKSMEGNTPGFGQALAKTYIERFSAYKWAKAVMEGAGHGDHGTVISRGDSVRISQERAEELSTAIQQAYPKELKDYHVLFVHKDDLHTNVSTPEHQTLEKE
eukprot:TRINITY_DN4246_c0_g1_i7.p1 TRINITY_DN4246_c0_g1~~TRINITY_DN4246_c0_g1_i7.p1  ORF type:complete len:199 (-),score=58.40 TRINITY_DN4246_c0_g1_i7:217-813(-)